MMSVMVQLLFSFHGVKCLVECNIYCVKGNSVSRRGGDDTEKVLKVCTCLSNRLFIIPS